jgi:hypothetical protein
VSLARRLADHFVLPAGDDRPGAGADLGVAPRDLAMGSRAQTAPRAYTAVAALTGAADACALGAALGLALARVHRVPMAAVCVWIGGSAARPPSRAPALPAARRLAAGLCARGHDARASGRLVLVALGGPDEAAATEARHALTAADAVPAVLAIGGPRTGAFDGLLADQDLVVVGTRTGVDPVLTRLAVAGLAGGVRACACDVPSHCARALASAGLVLLPSARRGLAPVLEELS